MDNGSFTTFLRTGPRMRSATTGTSTTIVIVFSEAMTVTTAGWSALLNGSNLPIASVSGSGTTWTFVVDPMAYGDVITISYNSVTGNTVTNPGGVELASFTNRPVTNTIPVVTSIVRAITIDHTKVPNTDLTDFPVLFSGTYSYLKTVGNGGDVENVNGYDIGFYSDSAATTKLKWEIESWDGTTGAVIYWVKVPSVSHTADTVIYLGYGNSAITTNQSDPTNVWDSNYKGVWHLPDGTTLTADDSTANANNGTLGTFGPDPTTGYIDGGALAISGNSPNIDLGTDTSLEISGAITLSCWVNFSNVGILQNIICRGAEDYRLRLNGQSIEVGSYDGSDHQTSYSSSIATSTWVYLSGGYDGSNWKLFYNGSLVSTTADATGAIANTSRARLMATEGGTQRFMEGILDEARISDTFRSADWIATEYNSQSSPSTFYAIGSPI